MRFLALALAAIFLSGCFFDQPLTGGGSKDLNTWLLGVWEHKDEKGKVYNATVLPLSAGKMTVWFKEVGKTPKQTKQWKFEAWISKVGNSSFLTLKCLESAGQVPPDAYVFAHYQVINQENVIARPLQLESPPETSSFKLRVEVRRKLKEKTLLPIEGTVWTRTSEVYWDRADPQAQQPYQEPRFVPPPSEDKMLQKLKEEEQMDQTPRTEEDRRNRNL